MTQSIIQEDSNDYILSRANPLLYSLVISDSQYFSPSRRLLRSLTDEELIKLHTDIATLRSILVRVRRDRRITYQKTLPKPGA